ncbi:MAG TPA: hypothetical protein VFN87_17205 [Solirubrobacteraceae bacterium]|nr:hypothetical protein [Solirubrobacteraceae bacterium]
MRLRAAAGGDGERALGLWSRYEAARGRRERRFLRRAYERARDRALGPWTPWSTPLAPSSRSGQPSRPDQPSRPSRPRRPRRREPALR